jgi:hypothetical protein
MMSHVFAPGSQRSVGSRSDPTKRDRGFVEELFVGSLVHVFGFSAVGFLLTKELKWNIHFHGDAASCNKAVQQIVGERRSKKDGLYGLRESGEYQGKALLMTVLPTEWCRNTLLDLLLANLSPDYQKKNCTSMADQMEVFADLVSIPWDRQVDAVMSADEHRQTLMYKVLSSVLLAWLCDLPLEKVRAALTQQFSTCIPFPSDFLLCSVLKRSTQTAMCAVERIRGQAEVSTSSCRPE